MCVCGHRSTRGNIGFRNSSNPGSGIYDDSSTGLFNSRGISLHVIQQKPWTLGSNSAAGRQQGLHHSSCLAAFLLLHVTAREWSALGSAVQITLSRSRLCSGLSGARQGVNQYALRWQLDSAIQIVMSLATQVKIVLAVQTSFKYLRGHSNHSSSLTVYCGLQPASA
jgi:hypothetical protein